MNGNIIAQDPADLRHDFQCPQFLDSEETYNPLPADTATIPAAARGTFHLPPATDKPARFVTTGQTDFVILLHRNSRLAHHHSLLSSACCPIGGSGASPGRCPKLTRGVRHPAPKQPAHRCQRPAPRCKSSSESPPAAPLRPDPARSFRGTFSQMSQPVKPHSSSLPPFECCSAASLPQTVLTRRASLFRAIAPQIVICTTFTFYNAIGNSRTTHSSALP